MRAPDQLPRPRTAGFGRHQIWCDGEVLYRVEPCPLHRQHCRLLPLNGASTAPLTRPWSHTHGLRRVR